MDPSPASIQYVRVDHRGLDVLVPQEFLDGSDVVAVFEEMRGERVTQGVEGGALRDPAAPAEGSACCNPPVFRNSYRRAFLQDSPGATSDELPS